VLKAVIRLNHPTAQEVYEYLREKEPRADEKRISLATVYRNLQILTEDGKISSLSAGTAEGVIRYDGRLDPHYHIRCEICGSVMDAHIGYMETLNKSAGDARGFAVKNHVITFSGVCRSCQAK
jgi:Fe2+ or Zn2+ uptake regulation protein